MSFAQGVGTCLNDSEFQRECQGCYFRILLFLKAYWCSCKYSLHLWSHSGRERFGFKHVWLLKNPDCKIGWLHTVLFSLRISTALFKLAHPGQQFPEGTEKQHLGDVQSQLIKGPLSQGFCVSIFHQFSVSVTMSHYQALGSPVWMKLLIITFLGSDIPPHFF